MARKISNWVFIDTQTNEAFCKRCGQRERPPLPAPISTFVKWCEYFGDKHKGCGSAILFRCLFCGREFKTVEESNACEAKH
jgi:hypothetical protein